MIFDRSTKLVGMLDLARQEGLEIGPLDHAVVAKQQAKISYADRASVTELKEKYAADPNVRLDRIVPLDYVTGGKPLAEVVGTRRFDYVIASHVLERVPDMIGFLQDVAKVLRVDGFLCLAIPDKRYTFDYFRNDTVLADLIDANLRRLQHPSSRQIFDHFVNARQVSCTDAWSGPLQEQKAPHAHTMEAAWQAARNVADSERYLDCHCQVFTPTSFIGLLRGLFELDLVNLKVSQFWATAPNEGEFFVILQRLDPDDDTETKRNTQVGSLPPPEITCACTAVCWPDRSKGVLLGSRFGSFDGKVFYALGPLRYRVVEVQWALDAGFRWPDDIIWALDDEIAVYPLASGPPPPAEFVRGQAKRA
jgi:predicted SAM-dependent methyltransferase